jgi:putative DNA primase/helicase
MTAENPHTGPSVVVRRKRTQNGQQRKQEHKQNRAQFTPVLPPPSLPMAVARAFVDHSFREGGELALRYWRDGWWHWRRSHWREVEYRAIRSLLYRFTEHAIYLVEQSPAPWAPNRKKIGDVLEALEAVCILPQDIDQPTWLDGRETGVIVALANGLLDVERRVLLPHDVHFFNTTAVEFDYDPNATKPARWLKLLDEIWPPNADVSDDGEDPAVRVLGEWFGYVLSGRTDLHKIFLHVGPTRGGKGLIARVLTALLGKKNVVGPTLHSLGGEFGLAPLIGKSLAVISDARFARSDNIVVERLLSISGEDALTVNRKYRDQWTGKLPTRLHVISNELPKLGDASTAIVGRLVVLMSDKSWLGNEDVTLEDAILQGLPGILNWSLDGLARLVNNRNRFTRVEAFDEAIIEMRDLASPVAAFVRQRCVLGDNNSVVADELYTAFKQWAEDSGYRVISRETFGRDLRASALGVRRVQVRAGKDRYWRYEGIRPAIPEIDTPDDG